MKNLYGSIKISKTLDNNNQCIEEYIDYYKLNNKKYGFEIIKKGTKAEKLEIKNINENEEKIDILLNDLVIKEITPTSEDIIEDLIKIHTS